MGRARTPGQRAGLTHTAVLDAAHALLAERGLDGLTMRALAERLGVAPNALYSHVASKTTLVDDMLDGVLAEVQTPTANRADPVAALHALMVSTWRVLLAHQPLVPLYLARQGARGANAERLGEDMRRLLASAGLPEESARAARRVLIVYTIGFAAIASQPAAELSADRPLGADEMFDNFAVGLRWLLAGITQQSSLA